MAQVMFVHNSMQSFVRTDLELLEELWEVAEHYQRNIHSTNPIRIFRAVKSSNVVFCWFASWHSLIPVICARLLGKPSLVVVGGYDIARIPEAQYGSQRGGLRKFITNLVLYSATKLIAFSNSAALEVSRNIPAVAGKVDVIHLGVPTPQSLQIKRENIVLNVGGVWKENLLRKGLKPFVEAAAYLPDVQFVHIGRWYDNSIDYLRSIAPPNVRFIGYVDRDELDRWFQGAAVYVQPSLHEGFGMSVAEAMISGCIPVVTRAGSLPEICGDTAIYAETARPIDLAHAIRIALNASETDRKRVCSRIRNNFTIEQRRQQLQQLVRTYISGD